MEVNFQLKTERKSSEDKERHSLSYSRFSWLILPISTCHLYNKLLHDEIWKFVLFIAVLLFLSTPKFYLPNLLLTFLLHSSTIYERGILWQIKKTLMDSPYLREISIEKILQKASVTRSIAPFLLWPSPVVIKIFERLSSIVMAWSGNGHFHTLVDRFQFSCHYPCKVKLNTIHCLQPTV